MLGLKKLCPIGIGTEGDELPRERVGYKSSLSGAWACGCDGHKFSFAL
jgi:hypothetical protein